MALWSSVPQMWIADPGFPRPVSRKAETLGKCRVRLLLRKLQACGRLLSGRIALPARQARLAPAIPTSLHTGFKTLGFKSRASQVIALCCTGNSEGSRRADLIWISLPVFGSGHIVACGRVESNCPIISTLFLPRA